MGKIEVIKHSVYVGVGSNYGDSLDEIARAFVFLGTLSIIPSIRSALWHSEPIGCPEGSPYFYNAVVGITPATSITAIHLLDILQGYEFQRGRPREHGHNLPRSIDLDILYFRGECLHSQRLELPHPRATQRRFVMEPLAEIAPELSLLPGGATARKIANTLKEAHPEQQICIVPTLLP